MHQSLQPPRPPPLPGSRPATGALAPISRPVASRTPRSIPPLVDLTLAEPALDDSWMTAADPPPCLDPPAPPLRPITLDFPASPNPPQAPLSGSPRGLPVHRLPDIRRQRAFAEELLLCDAFVRQLPLDDLNAACNTLHYLLVGLDHAQPLLQSLPEVRSGAELATTMPGRTPGGAPSPTIPGGSVAGLRSMGGHWLMHFPPWHHPTTCHTHQKPSRTTNQGSFIGFTHMAMG